VPTGDPPRSRDPTRELRLAIAALCGALLPEAIGLTDAFEFSDWELDRYVRLFSLCAILISSSALGVYDGRAYEALWKKVQEEPLNQTEVTEAYEVCLSCYTISGISLSAGRPQLSRC